MFHRLSIATLVAVSLFVARPSLGATGLALVTDGADICPIYTSATPDGQEKTAATQLAAYLSKMSGAQFTVAETPYPLPTRGIFVGKVEGAPADGLKHDAFRIRLKGQQLFIIGDAPRSTMYGVFALLEQMGCRWWSWNEEDVPAAKATLCLDAIDLTVAPAFSMHNPWNNEAGSTQNYFSSKIRSTSWESYTGGHSLYPLLTPYAKEHNEIYPMNKDGERKHNDLHFCYLAPGIIDALVDALSKQVEARKGRVDNTIYFAGMGDWYGGMCECPDCKKIYEEETWTDPDGRKKAGYTGTLLRMINAAAEKLEAKYPGIRIGTFAYMSLEAPPAITKPRRNVVIQVPRLRHCGLHAAEDCQTNRSFLRNIQRWCEIDPGNVYIWEYGVSFKNFQYPFPCLNSMSANLKLYHKLGINGVAIQGNYVSTGSDLVVLKNYVWRRIFWDANLDPHKLTEEFCQGYYGPAAKDMVGYVNALEKSVLEPNAICGDEFGGVGYLTEPVRKEMSACRDAALAKVAGQDPFERRVHEATVGFDHLALWTAGPLEERGDRLIRKDANRDTVAEVEAAFQYLRGGGFTEWSGGRSQQMGVLRSQGGPLVTLTRGPVTVKIAPLLVGQTRQITYNDKPVLYMAKANEKGYPLIGGSNEGLGMMSIDGKAEATKVRLQGYDGPGAAALAVWKTVEIDEAGAIVVTGSAKGTPQADKRGARVSTAYPAGSDPDAMRIAYKGEGDQWTALSFANTDGNVAVPATAALRISLPDSHCIVTDNYGPSGASGGTITLNRKNGTVTTVINAKAVELPAKEEGVFLQRKIELAPLVAREE